MKEKVSPVGSQKRKARKATITHLVPQSPVSKVKGKYDVVVYFRGSIETRIWYTEYRFSATSFWPSVQELREKYSDRFCLSMQTTRPSSQSCDINWLVLCTDESKQNLPCSNQLLA
jgi:hypothetical protein